MMLGSAGAIVGSPLAIVEPAMAGIGQRLKRLLFGRKPPRYSPGGGRDKSSSRSSIISPGMWSADPTEKVIPQIWNTKPVIIFSRESAGETLTISELNTKEKVQIVLPDVPQNNLYGTYQLTNCLMPGKQYELYLGDSGMSGMIGFRILGGARRMEVDRKLKNKSIDGSNPLKSERLSVFFEENLFSDLLGEMIQVLDDSEDWQAFYDLLEMWYKTSNL
jgi:hypothetical protein